MPHVVGNYAHRTDGPRDRGGGDGRAPYILLTERIDPYLLSHTGQTLRRMRRHDLRPPETSFPDLARNYKLAIADSDADVRAEDPLRNLMLNSASRETLQSIREASEEYEWGMSDPLEDEECEAVPRTARWMMHSFPTCNPVHEFDFVNSLRRDETGLLGHGFWRDCWDVLDTEPSSRKLEKKVALKTIRYEHDYEERNYGRHERDAIVSERLTSSPRVMNIHAFCGHSGYYEFAPGGSLADRLWKQYVANVERHNAIVDGNPDAAKEYDRDILDQRSKLSIAHQVAAGLADMHDADAMRDGDGKIASAVMVHADITPDQFVLDEGGMYKLNDFNRCRFMRRYRGSGGSGGDGRPCGFYIGTNPAKARSPEEYAYGEETEKIDIYSMGNIFYTMLTDLDPWEDTEEEAAQKAVAEGKRPNIPDSIKFSEDFVDAVLRTIMYRCWEQKPEDRPRAREVADILEAAFNTHFQSMIDHVPI